MFRSATVVLLLLGLSASSPAQDRQPGDPIPLLVSAAPAPTPSLKYRLALDRRDLIPGNAATLYYRTHAILYENSALLKELKEIHWSEWSALPLAELPRAEMREKLNYARHVIHEAEVAGRRRDCDWQLEGREEGLALLLPEVQGYRGLATVLAVKARLAMAEGRFDEAVSTLRIGMTLGRNLAQGPTLIHVLVGIACSQVMLKQVEDLIQQPDAPNMYWALTALSHPFIDPRKATLDDTAWVELSLPFLKRLDGGPMTVSEIQAACASLLKMSADFQIKAPERWETLAQAAYIEAAHTEAKDTLIKGGLKADAVAAMPSFQAVALFAYREYRETHEEVIKWIHVPEGHKHPAFKQAVARHQRAAERFDRLFFRGLIGALGGPVFPEKVFGAADRLERHLAALRCVEAVRMQAARTGQWPAKLEDFKDVPVPVDPLTGKPFDYKLRDSHHAVLSTPIPMGEPLPANMTYNYHLTLRK